MAAKWFNSLDTNSSKFGRIVSLILTGIKEKFNLRYIFWEHIYKRFFHRATFTKNSFDPLKTNRNLVKESGFLVLELVPRSCEHDNLDFLVSKSPQILYSIEVFRICFRTKFVTQTVAQLPEWGAESSGWNLLHTTALAAVGSSIMISPSNLIFETTAKELGLLIKMYIIKIQMIHPKIFKIVTR